MPVPLEIADANDAEGWLDERGFPSLVRRERHQSERDQKFESRFLQRTVRPSPDFTRVSGKEELAWMLFSTAYLRTAGEPDDIRSRHRDFAGQVTAMVTHFCRLYDGKAQVFRQFGVDGGPQGCERHHEARQPADVHSLLGLSRTACNR